MRPRRKPLTVLATNPNADLYGASRMFRESVEAFLAQGWRVVVCFSSSGPLVDELRLLGAEVRVATSPVLRRSYLSGRGLLELVALAFRAAPMELRILREVRPDVVYVNTIIEPLWLASSRARGFPVVCHVHEAESSVSALLRRALALPLLLAHRVIVNSRFTMDVLDEVIPRLDRRSRIVLNGVAGPPRVVPPRPELVGAVRLVCLGRIAERKGIADAVDALRALRDRGIDARLDIVGSVYPGYEYVERDLHRRVATTGVADSVRFHGFDADVWPHLAHADILVVPSRTDESFGNTAIEGLLAARPVVVTDVGALPEAVAGFDAVDIVPPAEPDRIADAVGNIVDSWNGVRKRAVADAAAAAERHSPEGYRSSVATIVESVR